MLRLRGRTTHCNLVNVGLVVSPLLAMGNDDPALVIDSERNRCKMWIFRQQEPCHVYLRIAITRLFTMFTMGCSAPPLFVIFAVCLSEHKTVLHPLVCVYFPFSHPGQ